MRMGWRLGGLAQRMVRELGGVVNENVSTYIMGMLPEKLKQRGVWSRRTVTG